MPSALPFPVIKFFNRVLSDYPAARVRLKVHKGKVVAATIGPLVMRMRVTNDGEMEPVGDTGLTGAPPRPDVSLALPLSLLPGLAARDPEALAKIVFTGDSELAATLADIARNVEWDAEEDLSRIVGDVAAHRIVESAQQANAWWVQAGERLGANFAEYLTEERRAFIDTHTLEELAQQNESLRDDIDRLDARVTKLTAGH